MLHEHHRPSYGWCLSLRGQNLQAQLALALGDGMRASSLQPSPTAGILRTSRLPTKEIFCCCDLMMLNVGSPIQLASPTPESNLPAFQFHDCSTLALPVGSMLTNTTSLERSCEAGAEKSCVGACALSSQQKSAHCGRLLRTPVS